MKAYIYIASILSPLKTKKPVWESSSFDMFTTNIWTNFFAENTHMIKNGSCYHVCDMIPKQINEFFTIEQKTEFSNQKHEGMVYIFSLEPDHQFEY